MKRFARRAVALQVALPHSPAKCEAKKCLRKFICENPIKVISSALLGVGLLLILGYFFHISYFPVFDIASTASLLMAAAFVGLFLLLLFGSSMLLPSWILITLFREEFRASITNPRIVGRLAGIGFLLMFLGLSVGVGWAWLASSDHKTWAAVLAITAPVIIGGSSWALVKFRWGLQVRMWVWGTGVFVLWLTQFYAIYVVVTMLSKAGLGDSWLEVIGPLAAIFALIAASGALIIYALLTTHRWARWLVLILILMGPIFVSLFLKIPAFFPMVVAKETKLGNFYSPKVTLTERGCSTMNSQIPGYCVNDRTTHYACNVHILSSVGKFYFIQLIVNGKNECKREPEYVRLLLPDSDVIGLAVDPENSFLSDKDVKERQQVQGYKKCEH